MISPHNTNFDSYYKAMSFIESGEPHRLLFVCRTYKEAEHLYKCFRSFSKDFEGIIFNHKAMTVQWPTGAITKYGCVGSDRDIEKFRGLNFTHIFYDDINKYNDYQTDSLAWSIRLI